MNEVAEGYETAIAADVVRHCIDLARTTPIGEDINHAGCSRTFMRVSICVSKWLFNGCPRHLQVQSDACIILREITTCDSFQPVQAKNPVTYVH